jgi:hypothetical protein
MVGYGKIGKVARGKKHPSAVLNVKGWPVNIVFPWPGSVIHILTPWIVNWV